MNWTDFLNYIFSGLFHRSIQESPYGTHRAVVLKPKEPAFALGREFGIHTEDPDELLNRLKKIPTKAIITAGAVVSLRRVENLIFEKHLRNNQRIFKKLRDEIEFECKYCETLF